MTATPRLVKSLTQVNGTDALVQIDGQVAALNDGGYVVVWTDSSLTYNPIGTAIVGQRYDSLGNKVGGEVKISQFSSGDQLLPAIASLPNGNVAIAFADTSAGNLDLYVRVFDASLGLVRTDTIDASINVTLNPSITAFADGSYVITFTAGSGADTDIVARVVSSSGTVGAQFDIDNQTDNRDMSEVATLANGNFVVTYVDEVSGSGTDTGVSYAVFSSAGAQVVAPAIVPGGDGVGLETDPHVSALRNGGFVVVWTDPDLGTNDIRASILNSNGTPILSDFLINTTTAGDQNEASVVALADRGFLVTWEDDNANLVRAQRFDATGNKIGTEFTVKDGTSPVDSPEAALLHDGGRIAYAVGDFATAVDSDVMTSMWRARDVSHDFDGDGKSGVLWRHDSGQVQFWEMDGLQVEGGGAAAHAPATNEWHILGTGDFDGDSHSDIIWQHDSGQIYIWHMNGVQTNVEGAVAHAAVTNDWHIQGTGDLNGDGNSDIVWRNDSGQVYIWEMDGLGIKAEGGVAHAFVPNDWQIQGVGDFDGDGNSDILWRQNSGQVYIWEMNGLTIKAEGGVAHALVPNDYHIQDIGEFNGDGKSDILWRHDSGQVYTWEMNGLGVTAEGSVPHAAVPSEWHIFSPYNFV